MRVFRGCDRLLRARRPGGRQREALAPWVAAIIQERDWSRTSNPARLPQELRARWKPSRALGPVLKAAAGQISQALKSLGLKYPQLLGSQRSQPTFGGEGGAGGGRGGGLPLLISRLAISRQRAGGVAFQGRSRTARTRVRRDDGVNGLWRNLMPEASTLRSARASCVYPET